VVALNDLLIEEVHYLLVQPDLFANFPRDRLVWGLAGLNSAARQRPVSATVVLVVDHEDAAVADDRRAHPLLHLRPPVPHAV
jgi:hypothetical protein